MKQYLFIEMNRHDGELSQVSRHEFDEKMTVQRFKEFIVEKYDLSDEDDSEMIEMWEHHPIKSSKDGTVLCQDCEETNYMMIAI